MPNLLLDIRTAQGISKNILDIYLSLRYTPMTVQFQALVSWVALQYFIDASLVCSLDLQCSSSFALKKISLLLIEVTGVSC